MRAFETRFLAGFDFATSRSSSPPCSRSCICLFEIVRGSLISQIAARGHGIAHDDDLTEILVPFIKCETAFRRNVGKLVFRTNVFDLDFGIQVDSVQLPIELDSVGSGHVSHRRTSAFNNHFDYCFIFKKIRKAPKREKLCVRCDVINISPANICRPVRLFFSFLRWNDFQVVYHDKGCRCVLG